MPTPTTRPTENLQKKAVEAHFFNRPSLRSVVTQLLTQTLKEKYPRLSHPLSDLRLALPRDGGGRGLRPLLNVALQYLADGRFPDLATRHNLDSYLSDATGTRLTFQTDSAHDYDLQVVRALIQELPLLLCDGFQQALATYWGRPGDTGRSRWQWLAGVLQDMLRTSAIRQSGRDDQQLQVLSTLANYPTREARSARLWPDNAIHAYTLETQGVRDATTVTWQASDVLVVSGQRAWLYCVSGQIEAFASLDAFGQAWGERMGRQLIADKITWRLYEPDGDIFEVQAALVLNRQLEDLAAVPLPAATAVETLEQLFESITHPAALFTLAPLTAMAPLAPIQAALPDWLRNASPVDLDAYRQCLLEQASQRRLTQGEGYLDGLDDIRTYAASHLDHQLCLEQNAALHGARTCTDIEQSTYKASELELIFDVPVGTLQSGYIEKVTMSLVDLALKNLSGRPNGRMTVRHTGGRQIEAWLTPEYLLALIQRVDVGRNYPAYIQQALLSDTPDVEKRKRLFCGQRPIDLKTQALDAKIKAEAGLTQRGFRCVKAVVGTQHTERWVDHDEVVMRALAFQRKPGAKADGVQNMFIIEPRDTQVGPHLLYRPAYRESLLEFASRDALLAAIAQPGEIQESVLAWMTDKARPIYSNGGFNEPHYVRIVGTGSEFDPLPSVPKPATLAAADDESNSQILQALNNGKLMEYLFVCEARQLLDQADRDATSNAQSRWALILEGVHLGFNTLLMLVRGPLAVVGWLMQLAQSLKQDLPALESQDAKARELAWVDLLLNTGMVLLHHGLPTGASGRPAIEDAPATLRALERLPLRRAPGSAIGRPPVVERGAIGLPSEPPGAGQTVLDFDRSLASDSASARLLEKLLTVNVPWPDPAPAPIESGHFKGLFKIGERWHAAVAGLLFRVSVVPGFGEVFVIHPDKPEHPGIKLTTDGNGHWMLDRGVKLTGGGKSVAQLRRENQRKVEQLQNQILVLQAEIMPPMAELRASVERMNVAHSNLTQQAKTLKLVWELLKKATETQRPSLEMRHRQELQSYARLRTEYEVLLKTLEERHMQSLPKRKELFTLGKALEKVAGARGHVQDLAKTLETIWDEQQRLHLYLKSWTDFLRSSDRGEPMADLAKRMLADIVLGDTAAYDEHIAKAIELADTQQRMAIISGEMEAILELLEGGTAGELAMRKKLLATLTSTQYFFPESLKLNALTPLSWIAVRLPVIDPSPQEALYIEHLDHSSLSQALLSHIEVRSSTGYALDEQRQVYGTILDKYRSYENAIEALKLINPSRLHAVADRLLNELRDARALAENELETVIRKQEALEVEESRLINRPPKAPTKRIFKTRKRKYFIGDLKPADGSLNRDQINITDTLTGETVASFDQQAGEWVEVPDVTATAPQPMAQTQPLATLKNQGQKLIRQSTEIQHLITRQQQQLASVITRQKVNPADWDELLTAQAKKLTDLADEIAREHSTQPSAHNVIEDYRAHAKELERIATRLCSAAYKQQWPTLESLDYLWRHKAIDINLTSRADPQRPTLSGDFFTEYAVYDKAQKPPAVLWYAHFHYADADAPPHRYTRAHLKLASQRKFTQKDLLKPRVQAQLHSQQAPGAEPIEKILYVLISAPQDRLFLDIAPASQPTLG